MQYEPGGRATPRFKTGYIPDYFLLGEDCPVEYFDTPPAPEHPTRVTRTVWDHGAFGGKCSTDFVFIDVPMPRVTFIDGPYAAGGVQ